MKKIVLLMLLVFTTLFTGCFTESKTKVEGVLITSDKYIIAQGETLQLDAVVYPQGVDYSSVRWVSYDEDVATISSSGLVRGVSKGSAVITLSVDGNVSSMTVNVEEAGILTLYSSSFGMGAGGMSVWEGYGAVETDLAVDGYDKAIDVDIVDSGWMSLVFNNLDATILDEYDQISFKIKTEDLETIKLYLMGQELEVTIADGTGLDNGWYEVTVPFSDFTGTGNADGQIAFIHAVAGAKFYVTDIVLKSTSDSDSSDDSGNTTGDDDSSDTDDTTGGGDSSIVGMNLYTSSEGAIHTNIGEPGWGSGSSLVTLNNTTEGSYANVMEWAMGTGWGGPAAACGFNGLSDLTPYTTFKAKFKYTDTNSATAGTFEVQMVGAPTQAKIIYDTDTDNWTGLDNGWIEISLPLSEFGSLTGVTQMVLIVKDDASNPVYFTDISFE